MKRKQRIPHDVSIYLCYLHQDRLWLTQWLSCPTVNHFGTPENGP